MSKEDKSKYEENDDEWIDNNDDWGQEESTKEEVNSKIKIESSTNKKHTGVQDLLNDSNKKPFSYNNSNGTNSYNNKTNNKKNYNNNNSNGNYKYNKNVGNNGTGGNFGKDNGYQQTRFYNSNSGKTQNNFNTPITSDFQAKANTELRQNCIQPREGVKVELNTQSNQKFLDNNKYTDGIKRKNDFNNNYQNNKYQFNNNNSRTNKESEERNDLLIGEGPIKFTGKVSAVINENKELKNKEKNEKEIIEKESNLIISDIPIPVFINSKKEENNNLAPLIPEDVHFLFSLILNV